MPGLNKDLVTIDPKAIVISTDKAGNFALTIEAETELKKILDFKKLIDDLYAHVEATLTAEMSKRKLQKIVGADVIVSTNLAGPRFDVFDKETAKDFLKEVKYFIPDPDKIDEFTSTNGELPKGVSFKTRSSTTRIVERGNE